MRILSIGTDRGLFKEGSEVSSRILEYGKLVEELYIIVFAQRKLGLAPKKIGENVWVYPTNSSSRFFYIRDAVRIGKKIIKEHTVDIVSTQDPFETGLVGLRFAREYNVPLQVQIHTDFLNPAFAASSYLNRVRVRIARNVLLHARGIRVVSERIKDSLLVSKIILQVIPEVLPIFVDTERIRIAVPPFDLHEKYPQFNFIALIASRLEKEKNISLALRAFAQIVSKHPKVGLVVAGEGSERTRLAREARALNIVDNVVFVGWQDDLTSYFRGADVFLSTSKYEGYGLSLVQAAVSGCPIVATDAGIASDLLLGVEHPVLCEVSDEECLAKALMLLVECEDVRRGLSLEIQTRVAHFAQMSKEKYLSEYKRLWESCLE